MTKNHLLKFFLGLPQNAFCGSRFSCEIDFIWAAAHLYRKFIHFIVVLVTRLPDYAILLVEIAVCPVTGRKDGVKMKLRTRLVIAFLTIVMIPAALFYMSLNMLTSYQAKAIYKNYGIEGSADLLSGAGNIQIFDSLTRKIYKDVVDVARTNPEKLEETAYLEQVNQELSKKHSFLIVRKGEELFYLGAENVSNELLEQLPEYGDNRTNNGSIYTGSQTQSLVKAQDFLFADKTQGTAFIVTPASQLLPEVKLMFSEMMMSVVIILIFTACILIVWIYRSILHPLGQLQKATKEIKEGNLDFEMEIREKDEIGQLCMDFEEMRERLKDSTEERLRNDQENKELISNISHDLKTPLTAIKGYAEGLMEGVASSPEKVDKYVRTIYNKANDMEKLIEELTFYSKIDTNKIPYTFKKINVNDYFRDCVEEIGLDLEAKDIELGYFNYTDADIVVIADAEQLKRVINNIISNSVKYLDKRKGIINIRIKDVGDFIQVEIEDNGRGIAQKDLPFIFDRFYRTDSSRNSSKGGSGIGLSIVKKIIEDHGGRIWATSKESIGTVMHFVLRKYQEVVNE